VPDEDPDIPVAAQEPVLEPEIAIEEEMPPVDLQIDFKANDEGAEENTAECASETENSNMDAVPDSGTAGEGVSARPDMPNASAPSDKRKPARKKKNRSSKEKELEEPMPDVELDDISDLFGGFL
jgi:hypothetical protein